MYVALLRAVNVGGRVVKMERLRALFEELRFRNVRTYIQSGNVFFETAAKDRAALTRKIERHLAAELGFETAAFVRTIEELEAGIALDPFRNVNLTPDERPCTIFVSQALPTGAVPHRSPKGDMEFLHATAGELFAVTRFPPGRPGNPSAYVEKTFGGKATTRFFDTMGKMVAAARAGGA
jgi:uncharacterized protein (DUF1697 family)